MTDAFGRAYEQLLRDEKMRRDALETARLVEDARAAARLAEDARVAASVRQSLAEQIAFRERLERSLAAPPWMNDAVASLRRQQEILDQVAGSIPRLETVADLGAAARRAYLNVDTSWVTWALAGLPTADALASLRRTDLAGLYQVAGLAAAYAPFQRADGMGTLGISRDTTARLVAEYGALQAAARQAAELRAALDPLRELAGVSRMVHELDVDRFGAHLSASGTRRLIRSLDRLSSSVGAVWEEFAAAPVSLAAAPELLRGAPTLQLYVASRGTALILGVSDESLSDDPTVGPERGSTRSGAAAWRSKHLAERTDADAAVHAWLAGAADLAARLDVIGPGLAAAYRGAVRRVRERGDDYIRQTTISLRELLEAVLVSLAPDDVVKTWYGSRAPAPKLDDGTGKLSRRARLEYLYRDVGNGAFAQHVGDEVKLIQQTFYALNDGVHGMPVALTDEEVGWLLARVNGQLMMILAVAGR